MKFRMLALLAVLLLPLPLTADSFTFALTTDEKPSTVTPPPDSVLVTVDRTSPTVATVTFTAEDLSGKQYYMTEAFINVSGTYTITATGSPSSSFALPIGTGALDAFGTSTDEIRDDSGTNDTSIVITLDATGATTWANAASVLTPTSAPTYPQGFDAYATVGTSPTTQYAGNNTEDLAGFFAPEPSSLLLLGTGMLGLAFLAFRKAKSSSLALRN
jgi:hypothetical protein